MWQTDGRTELRWLRRAESSIAAFAYKNWKKNNKNTDIRHICTIQSLSLPFWKKKFAHYTTMARYSAAVIAAAMIHYVMNPESIGATCHVYNYTKCEGMTLNMALNSILMNLCLPYWKGQWKVRYTWSGKRSPWALTWMDKARNDRYVSASSLNSLNSTYWS